jgi:hypothetical protein
MLTRFRNEPYLIINTVFAGVILMIFIYSGIFSPVKDNYPVTCIHQKLTGLPCISCGLSHSFSLMVRGRFEDAAHWNSFGPRIFLFFVVMLLLRVLTSFLVLRYPARQGKIVIADSIISGVYLLATFWPFILNIVADIL